MYLTLNNTSHNDASPSEIAFQKLIASGSFIEVYQGTRTISHRQKRPKLPSRAELETHVASCPVAAGNGKTKNCVCPYDVQLSRFNLRQVYRDMGSDLVRSRQVLNAEMNNRRAITKIRRLIRANAGRYQDKMGVTIPLKMLTLSTKENIQDITRANVLFTRFMRALDAQFRNELGGQQLQYVAVHEPQRRGAIHYHASLFNFPFAQKVYSRLRKKWLQDSPFVNLSVRMNASPDALVNYMVAYLEKTFLDQRFYGKKRYFASKRLFKPYVSRSEGFISQFQQTARYYAVLGSYRRYSGDFFSGDAITYHLPNNWDLEMYLSLAAPEVQLEPEHYHNPNQLTLDNPILGE